MRLITKSIVAASLLAAGAFGQTRYKIVDLGNVKPSPPGQPYFIANTGVIAGAAPALAPADKGNMHAVLWYRGLEMDINANRLGGPNSQAFGVNERGQVVGEAQSSTPDNEDFCGFNAFGLPPSNTACRPFIWANGDIAELPNTLGGANAIANVINSRGEVVGLAETNQPEQGCPVHRFVPVMWQDGRMVGLQTLGRDQDGGAFGINDKGQAVGVFGSCAPFDPNSQLYLLESHAVFWDTDGSVHEIPNFGGTGHFAGHHACSINNRGEVVGHSDVEGDSTTYAFLWSKGQPTAQKLLPLDGDFASVALSINDRSDVVGASFSTSFEFHAFMWRNGVMSDLNKLAPNSPLHLDLAASINDAGEITGVGETETGEMHGFVAVPMDDSDDHDEHRTVRSRTASVYARTLLLKRLGIRAR